MEDNDRALLPDDPNVCVNCRIEPALDGYLSKLCSTCRERFIRYPIPKWIYGFGAGVLVIMLFSMAQLPRYMGAAADFARAESAIESHNYVTAQREIEKVLRKLPSFKLAKAYMLIACCYNKELEKAGGIYAELEHQTLDDDVVGRINTAVAFLSDMVPQDTTFSDRLMAAKKDSVPGLRKLFHELDTAYANDKNVLQYLVADAVYDMKDYVACKAMLDTILSREPDYYLALSLLAPVHRNLGKYDEAIADCNKLLEINHEDVGTISQMSRIELKRKHDKEAASYAERAYAIDSKDISAMEAMAMVAWFAGKKQECEQMLARIKNEEADSELIVYNRVLRVVNGTESYR